MSKSNFAIIPVASFLMLLFSTICVAQQQISVFDAGASTRFSDIGIDPISRDLFLVGNEDVGGSSVASVYELPVDQSAISRDTLVGFGGNVFATGISPDGSWISGTSNSGTGTAWQTFAPNSPIVSGTSFTNPLGTYDFNVGRDAFNGGVVGTIGLRGFPSNFVYRWEPNDYTFTSGPFELEFEARISATSADGGVTVGSGGDSGLETGFVFNESGFDQNISRANLFAVSPSGNVVGGFDFSTFDAIATIWTQGDDGIYEPENLMRVDPTGILTELFGNVTGITDSGYVIGSFMESVLVDEEFDLRAPDFNSGGNFIWHESFNGIDSQFLGAQDFDEWVLAQSGVALPSPLENLAGVAEDSRGFYIAVNGEAGAFVVSVPEPSSCVVFYIAATGILLRRRRNALCAT